MMGLQPPMYTHAYMMIDVGWHTKFVKDAYKQMYHIGTTMLQ
jgi:hypothetical protein